MHKNTHSRFTHHSQKEREGKEKVTPEKKSILEKITLLLLHLATTLWTDYRITYTCYWILSIDPEWSNTNTIGTGIETSFKGHLWSSTGFCSNLCTLQLRPRFQDVPSEEAISLLSELRLILACDWSPDASLCWFSSFFALRNRPPHPLALLSACKCRDSCKYGCKIHPND